MKKILFFLLCLCLSFSCLGCTSNFKSVIPNNSSKTPAQTTQTTTKKPEKIKFGDYTLELGRYVSVYYYSNMDVNVIYLNENNKCTYHQESREYKNIREGIFEYADYNYDDLASFPGIKLNFNDNSFEHFIVSQNNYFSVGEGYLQFVKSPDVFDAPTLSKGDNYITISYKKSSWNETINTHYKQIKNRFAYGYEIQYSEDKDFKDAKIHRVYSIDTTSAKIYNLNPNKKYYFKVSSFAYQTPSIYESSFFNNTYLIYSEFSNVAEIDSPAKCKPTVDLTEKQAKDIAFDKFCEEYSVPEATQEHSSVWECELVEFNNKEYYYMAFEWPSFYGTEKQKFNSKSCILSLDNTEFLIVETDYDSDYKNMYIQIY